MITLEYFDSTDFDQLLSWINDEDLLLQWAGTQFKFPLNLEKLDWYVKDTNDFDHSSTLIFKARDQESGKVVGHISLTSINRKNRSARITRVFVAESERGKGLSGQMVRLLMKVGFEDLHLHRMSLGVYHTNTSAINSYKKCGFKIDGVLRDIQKHKDSYWSLMEMSMLEDEYRGAEVGDPSDIQAQI